MKTNYLIILITALLFNACTYKSIEVDLLVHNAKVYTLNDAFENVEAFAVKDGKIVELGAERAIMNKYSAEKVIDAQKKFIYPGFIDAHCHFLAYGVGLTYADLLGTGSWQEVLDRVVDYSEAHPEGVIIGRGWDQNDWDQMDFPDNSALNALFPDRPVVLVRIDGHAIIVNDFILEMAGIKAGQEIEGGSIEVKDGKLSGILLDNAQDFVWAVIPDETVEQKRQGLLAAQKACFQVGLTTVDDAGLSRENIELIDEMQKEGSLKMRIYAMISDNKDDLAYYFNSGPYQTDRLNVRSVKVYADGALGSRGAVLLKPYADKHDEIGFIIRDFSHYDSIATACYENGFQMNTHCIGDSANRYLMDVYGKVLATSNDKRWRIEHAQIVEENDIEKFKQYNIIPSIQPTHATSDMYWAEDRLGAERMNEAYPYQSLLEANGLVALGTDFPVENIDPMLTFYAAVTRQDLSGWPEDGFLPSQRLSRKDALRGMTIWSAVANFEENEKGSLEEGKWADFVILDLDLMKVDESKIPEAKVLATFIGGDEVYKK
jgi:predicted amidohydrolase YtcJ